MMVINGATKSKNIYQNSQMRRTMTHLVYSCNLVLLLGLVNLPCGFTHIASVLKHGKFINHCNIFIINLNHS